MYSVYSKCSRYHIFFKSARSLFAQYETHSTCINKHFLKNLNYKNSFIIDKSHVKSSKFFIY